MQTMPSSALSKNHLTTPAVALRRAFAASRRIPNAPDPQRAARVHAWCRFMRAALGRELK